MRTSEARNPNLPMSGGNTPPPAAAPAAGGVSPDIQAIIDRNQKKK
jgi:hypothetical protein